MIKEILKRMKLEKTQTGRLVLPKIPQGKRFEQFNKRHTITSDPLVTEWMEDLMTRKGGDPARFSMERRWRESRATRSS